MPVRLLELRPAPPGCLHRSADQENVGRRRDRYDHSGCAAAECAREGASEAEAVASYRREREGVHPVYAAKRPLGLPLSLPVRPLELAYVILRVQLVG